MEHQFASRTAIEKKVIDPREKEHSEGVKGPSVRPPALQFKSFGGHEEEEESIQKKAIQRLSVGEEEPMQAKEGPVSATTGDKMPAGTQKQMEQNLGADFSQVKIHQNSAQAEKVNAQAFTQGNDLHFAPGKYDPSSEKGKELLGHELVHKVQQSEGRVQANTSVAGMPVNNDHALEHEADTLGAKAANAQLKPEDEHQ